MSGNRADLPGDLARVEAEIARLEAVVASKPHDVRAKRLLTWELEHLERVRATLRACGLAEVPE